jgi:hypothetical protein
MTKHRLPPDPELEQQLLAFPTVRLDETDPTLVDYWAVDDFPEGWPPQLPGSPLVYELGRMAMSFTELSPKPPIRMA